jgi:hypothetical protein
MVFCSTSFAIAIIFIFASIYLAFNVDKTNISNAFLSTLSEQQQKKYKNITEERKNIYFNGFIIGFIISLFLVILNAFLPSKALFKLTNKYQVASFTAGTTLLSTYFYYILAPKSDYMVMHLDNKTQKKEWLNIYKTMQFNYHAGLALGIIGMFFFGMIYC